MRQFGTVKCGSAYEPAIACVQDPRGPEVAQYDGVPFDLAFEKGRHFDLMGILSHLQQEVRLKFGDPWSVSSAAAHR